MVRRGGRKAIVDVVAAGDEWHLVGAAVGYLDGDQHIEAGCRGKRVVVAELQAWR